MLIQSRINKLNKTLEKYVDIVVYLDSKGYTIKKNKKDIEFNKLSSGERRLLTILVNLIFSDETHILIDEPELSMSLDFQNKLIPDVLQLCIKKTVFIATHAPFILEDFRKYDDNKVIKL